MARLSVADAARRMRFRLDSLGDFESMSENIYVDNGTGDEIIVIIGTGRELGAEGEHEEATIVLTASAANLDTTKLDNQVDAVIADFDTRETLIR